MTNRRWLRVLAVPVWLSLGGLILWVAVRQVDSQQLWSGLTGVALAPLLFGERATR